MSIPHATRFQVFKYKLGRLVRWTLIRAGIITAALALHGIGYVVGQMDNNTASASNIIIAAQKYGIPPILKNNG